MFEYTGLKMNNNMTPGDTCSTVREKLIYCEHWDISTSDIKEGPGQNPINDLKVMKYVKELINKTILDITNVKNGHD